VDCSIFINSRLNAQYSECSVAVAPVYTNWSARRRADVCRLVGPTSLNDVARTSVCSSARCRRDVGIRRHLPTSSLRCPHSPMLLYIGLLMGGSSGGRGPSPSPSQQLNQSPVNAPLPWQLPTSYPLTNS